MVAAVDTATVPADACGTAVTVNVAMFDATGVDAMAVSAFSAAARSADGQPWHREHRQPAVGAGAQRSLPGYPRMTNAQRRGPT